MRSTFITIATSLRITRRVLGGADLRGQPDAGRSGRLDAPPGVLEMTVADRILAGRTVGPDPRSDSGLHRADLEFRFRAGLAAVQRGHHGPAPFPPRRQNKLEVGFTK